jgi:hypothetical protein
MPKSRLVRILLALLLVVLFAGYFAFSTFLFSPTEGDYAADVSTLVPRDVDFFVAKADLAKTLPSFPEPVFFRELEATQAWRTFMRSPEYAELEREHGIEEALGGLEGISAQLRGLEPLKLFGGEDVAIAGFFRGPELEAADWAAYGRASWLGKLGASLLRYPRILKLDSQGIAVQVEGDLVSLSGAGLARPIHVTRVRDVVIAGTSADLVRKALDLEAHRGEDSFGQSAIYADQIENVRRGLDRDELELYVDWRAWSESRKLSGRWPNAQSQDFTTAFAGHLFQAGALKTLAGVLAFDQGVAVRLHADLSSELMTPAQKSLYRTRGVERSMIVQAARLARDDSAIFLFGTARLGDFLREMRASAERDLVALIEDTMHAIGYTGTDQLIEELDALFRGRFALIVRENDFKMNPEKDPPHNDEPVPAVALVLWTDRGEKAKAKIEELHQLVVRQQQRLQLQGRTPGSSGVFRNSVRGGFEIWEFWSPFIDGTGHLATAFDEDLYVISNSFLMVENVFNVYRQGGAAYPRLADRPQFSKLLSDGLDQANAVLWLDPHQLAPILRKQSQRTAERDVRSRIDWDLERRREEDKVLREEFPGEARGSLSPETQAKLNQRVDERIDQLERKILDEQVPALRAAYERRLVYLQAVSGVLAMVALDPKFLELSFEAIVPLEPAESEGRPD